MEGQKKSLSPHGPLCQLKWVTVHMGPSIAIQMTEEREQWQNSWGEGRGDRAGDTAATPGDILSTHCLAMPSVRDATAGPRVPSASYNGCHHGNDRGQPAITYHVLRGQ